jgi:hypothetical protein
MLITKVPNLEIIRDAGWHFNNLFPFVLIVEKVHSSVHTDLVSSRLLDELESRYKFGQEIYTGKQLQSVEIDATFPSAITKKLSDWQDFIFKQ